jgi:hypothetical protein
VTDPSTNGPSWDFDDFQQYTRVVTFVLDFAFTYGHNDREKREKIREEAAKKWPVPLPANVKHWAFRIAVRKGGRRRFDIENVPKLIVDAFCKSQIKDDISKYPELGLYEDDTLDHVTLLQVAGKRAGDNTGSTVVKIFASSH